jgi:hypothetical protein
MSAESIDAGGMRMSRPSDDDVVRVYVVSEEVQLKATEPLAVEVEKCVSEGAWGTVPGDIQFEWNEANQPEDAVNTLALEAVDEVAPERQRDKSVAGVVREAFSHRRPRDTRARRPRFDQSKMARSRRKKLERQAASLERDAEAARHGAMVLRALEEHAQAFGRPLDELLTSRGDERRQLDKVIMQLVIQHGRKPVLLATGYSRSQLSRAYRRGLE